MPSILIVDDLLSIHEMLDAVIQPTGYNTAFATDGEKALACYKQDKFDLVLADIDMKPMDGITLLKQLKAYDPSCVVIIMTAYASTESAVQALKFGAFDYLQKPFRVDELLNTLKRGIEFKQFSDEQPTAGTSTKAGFNLDDFLIGSSAENKRLIQQVKKLSTVRTPVLLQGEVGTGKTTIAEILHKAAGNESAPIVSIDCAVSSEQNFHDGLLGENGQGGTWVQQAKNGTLLLQNLDQLPESMQNELVSVLRNTAHGFRLICTTTADLEKLTEEGRFNDELFYRVAALPVALAPLRERTEDIPALVKFFTAKATNPNFDASLVEFTPESMEALKAHSWPGNLSDLGQVVTQIAASTETRIVSLQQIPLRIKDLKSWPTLATHLAEKETYYIEQVMRACRGDKALAARILDIEAERIP